MRALACLLLLVPGLAWAEPTTIIALFAAAAQAGGYITAFQAFVIVAAVTVIGSVNARRQSRKAAAAQRAEYNASLQDRSITVLRSDPPWKIVYGRAIVGGAIVDIFTSDKTAIDENGSSSVSYTHLTLADE